MTLAQAAGSPRIKIPIPSIVGVSLDGHVLVIDSKNKVRKLKKWNSTSGRKQYYEGNYDGPIIRDMQYSVPEKAVLSFEEWKEKNKIK